MVSERCSGAAQSEVTKAKNNRKLDPAWEEKIDDFFSRLEKLMDQKMEENGGEWDLDLLLSTAKSMLEGEDRHLVGGYGYGGGGYQGDSDGGNGGYGNEKSVNSSQPQIPNEPCLEEEISEDSSSMMEMPYDNNIEDAEEEKIVVDGESEKASATPPAAMARNEEKIQSMPNHSISVKEDEFLTEPQLEEDHLREQEHIRYSENVYHGESAAQISRREREDERRLKLIRDYGAMGHSPDRKYDVGNRFAGSGLNHGEKRGNFGIENGYSQEDSLDAKRKYRGEVQFAFCCGEDNGTLVRNHGYGNGVRLQPTRDDAGIHNRVLPNEPSGYGSVGVSGGSSRGVWVATLAGSSDKRGEVCRQWRDASSHEDFWRYLNFENRYISVQQFEDMCRRYPNATAVNVYGTPAIHPLVMKAISLLRNLEVLTLGKGQLGETFFIYHDRLHDLQIVKCRVLRISIRCPQLETLSLKRSSMPHSVLNCPFLRELDIASCHKLSDAAIRSAATSCPLLESMDMSNCSCVSDETLREIAGACPSLQVLDASYCPNISLESVRMEMLTVLKLHSCEGITSASMAAIANSYMLEILEPDNCSLLTLVSLELQRLKSIRLVHCRKFLDLNLRSNVLSSITVSNCPFLQRINIASNALRKLVLQKQESLTTLVLQCHYLQEVDLTECESLTNSICEVFSNGGGADSDNDWNSSEVDAGSIRPYCFVEINGLKLASPEKSFLRHRGKVDRPPLNNFKFAPDDSEQHQSPSVEDVSFKDKENEFGLVRMVFDPGGRLADQHQSSS